MRMSSTAIIVFVKLPLPGLVKTRLARGVGPVAAACFYRACATHIVRQAAGRCTAVLVECSCLWGQQRLCILMWSI